VGLLHRLTRGLVGDDRLRMGRYRVIRRLAEGGMGEIFLGVAEGESGFEKVVVLKRILSQKVDDRLAVRMFLDEARLMAALNHPNIVQVYDFGTADGAHFFAMEYVHGEDLGRIMKAATLADRPLSLELAIGVIAEAAAGLHYAHEKTGPDGAPLQIVHRDISPSNLLVSYDGAVKVTDFGIAKWSKRQTQTRYGGIKGKIAYMSPEQCRAGTLDRRSDVFGLGILLFELTTGTRLYQGSSDFAVLEQVVHDDVPRPSTRKADYPPEVEQIVMKALAKDPAQRHENARELQLELEQYALENRLMISAMARAAEMESRFGTKVEAWREAAHAGRSLGEHLAAEKTRTRPEVAETYLMASPESPVSSRRRVLAGAGVALAAGAASLLMVRRPASLRVDAAGLRPAESNAGGFGDPLRVPITTAVIPAPPPAPAAVAPPAPAGDIALEQGPPAERPPPIKAARSKPRRARRRPTAPAPAPPSAPANKVWNPDSIYLP
jgi:tRNA A-37 threonylcarbamoyl transferase component Bud32